MYMMYEATFMHIQLQCMVSLTWPTALTHYTTVHILQARQAFSCQVTQHSPLTTYLTLLGNILKQSDWKMYVEHQYTWLDGKSEKKIIAWGLGTHETFDSLLAQWFNIGITPPNTTPIHSCTKWPSQKRSLCDNETTHSLATTFAL